MPKRTAETAFTPQRAPELRLTVPDGPIAWTEVLRNIVHVCGEQTMFSCLPRDVLNLVGAFAGEKQSRDVWLRAREIMDNKERNLPPVFPFSDGPCQRMGGALAAPLVARGFTNHALQLIKTCTGVDLYTACAHLLNVLDDAPHAIVTMSLTNIDCIVGGLCASLLFLRNTLDGAEELTTYFIDFLGVLKKSNRLELVLARSADRIVSTLEQLRKEATDDDLFLADDIVLRLTRFLTEEDSAFARGLCNYHVQWLQIVAERNTDDNDIEYEDVPALEIILHLARFGHWTISASILAKIRMLLTTETEQVCSWSLCDETAMLPDDQLRAVFPPGAGCFGEYVQQSLRHPHDNFDGRWHLMVAALRLGAEYAPMLRAESVEFDMALQFSLDHDGENLNDPTTPSDDTPIAVVAQLVRWSLAADNKPLYRKSLLVHIFLAVSHGMRVRDDDLCVLLTGFCTVLRTNGRAAFYGQPDDLSVDVFDKLRDAWPQIIDNARLRRDDLWSLAVECKQLIK